MVTGNIINVNSTGIVKYDGAGTFSATTVTQHDLLIGGASNAITSVAPSSTSGVPVISQGSSADPIFGTVAIAGGGTNAVSFTQSNGIVTYNGTSLVNYAGPQISSGGTMTNTTQPAFSANNAGANAVTGDNTVYTIGSSGTAWTKVYDVGTNFNTNGTFTAPVTGKYHFTASMGLTGVSATATGVVPQIVTTAASYTGFTIAPFPVSVGGSLVLNFSCDANMTAGDTAILQVTVFGSTKNVNVQSSAANTFFQGRLFA